ncbi:MAG: 50S ribosomal protein L25 [Acidobacteria bacterium]|nr:50S ribosomal protein L25 [Acidobacteriota bacterium]
MEATLEARKRQDFGKNETRRLRASGRIPAVLYGQVGAEHKAEAVPLQVDPKALMHILHMESGANTLINLKLDGGETRVLVKEYQLHPVTHHLLHADFYRIAMDRLLVVRVPIVIKGEARGVKQQGGVLDFVTREIEVECLPADIPQHIEVDVSDLDVGKGIRVRELASSPRWKAMSDPDGMITHVVMPKAEEAPVEEAAVAAVAAPTEPELIKKGKVEKPEEEEEE